MRFSVHFLERREGDSPSIERVFRSVAENLLPLGIRAKFTQAKYGISILGSLGNLFFFRPDKSDIYHITGHINYMALVLPPERTVLTVHDLTVLDLRKGVRRWLIKWLYYILPTRRTRFLTAISDATKERLVRITGIPADRVVVIENPLLVERSAGRKFDQEKPTVLQIGNTPNKNIDRLIEALSNISCRLRIVGSLSDRQKSRLAQLNVDWTNDVRLSDDEMEAAYENSDLVTLCSTTEGFGLPIIEAQAKGVVVVASDRSPMREVAGSGARFVDPENVESIREGILDVIGNAELRARLVKEGRRNIERFDPATVAAKYAAVYETILSASEGRE